MPLLADSCSVCHGPTRPVFFAGDMTNAISGWHCSDCGTLKVGDDDPIIPAYYEHVCELEDLIKRRRL